MYYTSEKFSFLFYFLVFLIIFFDIPFYNNYVYIGVDNKKISFVFLFISLFILLSNNLINKQYKVKEIENSRKVFKRKK